MDRKVNNNISQTSLVEITFTNEIENKLNKNEFLKYENKCLI